MELDLEEGRVIGCLIEKQLTTPQQYPLSLNALALACNQQSNRDPVVAYEESTVQAALVRLKEAGLVRFVHPSHGRSVTRYRHVLDEHLGLDPQGLALVAVLLLRGPQTAGELRIRTERMAQFDGLGGVDSELARLADRTEPIVRRLPRRSGHKEDRWVQLLTPAVAPDVVAADAADPGYRPPAAAGALASRVEAQGVELAELRAEVDLLRRALEELRREIGA